MLKRNTWKPVVALAAGAALMVQAHAAHACTSFLLPAADGGFTYGRTMEFGLPMNSRVMVVPRAFAIAGTGISGTPGTGLKWTSKYGAVGLNGLDMPLLVDGMNEKGLAGGMLYLPGLAKFMDVPASESAQSIAAHELLMYLLTNFADVAEVKAAMPALKVNNSPQATFGAPAPLHVTLHDKSGKSLVIEYIGGKLHLHDNPTGVLTNAPSFDWHLANLGNYLGVSTSNPAPFKIGSLTINPPSTGVSPGMPGDMSSPSRFVRAIFFSQASPKPATSAEAVSQAFHLLNNFDIPPGSIRTSADSSAGGGVTGFETTEWMAVSDLKAGKFHFRTFDNSQTRVVDLNKLNLDAKELAFSTIDQKEAMIPIMP